MQLPSWQLSLFFHAKHPKMSLTMTTAMTTSMIFGARTSVARPGVQRPAPKRLAPLRANPFIGEVNDPEKTKKNKEKKVLIKIPPIQRACCAELLRVIDGRNPYHHPSSG